MILVSAFKRLIVLETPGDSFVAADLFGSLYFKNRQVNEYK